MQRVVLWLFIGSALASSAAHASDPVAPSLHELPGLRSDSPPNVWGVSGDGRVPIGYAPFVPPGSAGRSAVRWVNGVAQPLWSSGDSIAAYGASADGSVVVGYRSQSGIPIAVKNTGGVTTDLGPASLTSVAYAASADGSVIVGRGSQYAFRSTPTGIETYLPAPDHTQTAAFGVSADGRVVVGASMEDSGSTNPAQAASWKDGVRTDLPYITGFTRRSEARDVSPDGRAVVGYCMNNSSIMRASLWLDSGPVDLGALPVTVRTPMSIARGVSADGSVVVGASGRSTTTSGEITDTKAFIWTQQTGMVALEQLLQSTYGVDLMGWQLSYAFGISDDGRTIVGQGRNPLGHSAAWIVTIPAPAAGLWIAAAGLATRRRRRA